MPPQRQPDHTPAGNPRFIRDTVPGESSDRAKSVPASASVLNAATHLRARQGAILRRKPAPDAIRLAGRSACRWSAASLKQPFLPPSMSGTFSRSSLFSRADLLRVRGLSMRDAGIGGDRSRS